MGFLVLDALADESGIAVQKKKFEAMLGDGRIGSYRVLLVKPQTFMNLSGLPLRQILDYYEKSSADLVVVHDDLDLPFGTARIKVGGGDGGHKGVRSVMDHLGNGEFTRLRMGIGKPPFKDDTEHYVLQPFPKADLETLAEVVHRSCEAVHEILSSGVGPAMNRFNTRERKPAQDPENISE
jgi:PTH1 family peptidyl-tRNA hydrolase